MAKRTNDVPKRIKQFGYQIGFDYFDNNKKYQDLKGGIELNGYFSIRIKEGILIHVYTPELACILTTKELEVSPFMNSKRLVINGWDFVQSYYDGYRAGEEYFEKEFKVNNDTLYGANAKQYIQDLHDNYFHLEHRTPNSATFKGWAHVKAKYPLILDDSIIYDHGYYSGIVSKVESLRTKYPNQFAGFDKCDRFIPYQQSAQIKAIQEKKITITAYAIMHVYLAMFNEQAVTKQNKDALAKQYGYKSGDQLRNDFTFYQNDDRRLDLNTTNRRSAITHLNRFRDILPLLEKTNKLAFDKASQDYLTLKRTYDMHY